MKKSTTSAAVVPAAIIEDAWQEVGASFERFCLTTGLATLASMLEEDATQVCGARYDRADGRDGHRWGKTTGKVGFHGGKVEFERPRVRRRDGGEVTCQRRSKSTPLAGVKMHHLMRFSPALAVVPVVHRRDPRCFV